MRNKHRKQNRAILALILSLVFVFTFAFAYAGESISRYTATTYTHSSQFDNCAIANGIDISAYQEGLNWQKIHSSGIDFAIIRVGWTGQTTGKMYEDTQFRNHFAAAKEEGLMVGLYWYSQATTTTEARKEANLAVEYLNDAGYNMDDLDLPIFMDYEKAGTSKGRINNMTKSKRTKCANAFLEEIQKLGYTPGIYTDYSFATKSVDAESISQQYFYWAAQYYHQCDFYTPYRMWQYTSGGSVPGSTKRTDMNFWYVDLNPVSHATEDSYVTYTDEDGYEITAMVPGKKSLADARVSLSDTSYTYDSGRAFKPKATVTLNGSYLTEGIDYQVKYIGNTQAGTAYTYIKGIGDYTDYCLAAFTIKPNTNVESLSIGSVADRTYTGKVNKPSDISVSDSRGNGLVKGLDYSFTSANTKKVGEASLKITFTGNYTGKRTVKYHILKATPKITIANAPSEIQFTQEDFNIKASTNFDEAILTYESSDPEILTISTDGTVHVEGHGTATITVNSLASANLNAQSKSFSIFVKAPPQTITTSAESYEKSITLGSFNLKAKSNGDGALSYEVESFADLYDPLEYEELDGNEDEGYEEEFSDEYVEEPEEDFPDEDIEVVRVTDSGRVILMNPGTAIITVRAAETRYFEAGETQVEVVVTDISADTKEAKFAAITKAIEGTKISSFTATPKTGKITLKWKKGSAKYGVNCFQIYRSTKKSSGFKKVYESQTGTATTWSDKTVKASKTYYYKVRGVRYVNGKAVYTPWVKIQTKSK